MQKHNFGEQNTSCCLTEVLFHLKQVLLWQKQAFCILCFAYKFTLEERDKMEFAPDWAEVLKVNCKTDKCWALRLFAMLLIKQILAKTANNDVAYNSWNLFSPSNQINLLVFPNFCKAFKESVNKADNRWAFCFQSWKSSVCLLFILLSLENGVCGFLSCFKQRYHRHIFSSFAKRRWFLTTSQSPCGVVVV